jgi:uncharacterized protein (DUF2062 family)
MSNTDALASGVLENRWMSGNWVRSRVKSIAEGCSREKLALLLAIGLVLGTFPVFGLPTILCIVAALSLRLNMAALQVVNQLSSPLQLALLVPLARVGWKIPVTSDATALERLGAMALQAITGWLMVCVPVGFLVYLGLVYFLRRQVKA